MIRVKGFLDLDNYFIENYYEQFKTGELSKDDYIIESSYDNDHYWLKINDELYYFKPGRDIYEELIASECAKFLGIDAVEYDLAKFQGAQGVISKNYCKELTTYTPGTTILYNYLIEEKNQYYLEQMGCDIDELLQIRDRRDMANYVHNLEIIWHALEYRYKQSGMVADIPKLMKSIINQLCLNILIGQYDGHPLNWEVGEGYYGVVLSPFYDAAASFESVKIFDNPAESMSVSFEDRDTNNYIILETFFKTSSQEYIDVFIKYFEQLTVENFMIILKKVEDKIEIAIPSFIKQRILNAFSTNRDKIEIAINKFEKGRGVV